MNNARRYLIVTACAASLAGPAVAHDVPAPRPTSLANSSIASRTADYRAGAVEAFSPRLYAPSLVGKAVPRAATVQGAGQTVVANSLVVNPGVAGGSVLQARCPRIPGGRVVVANNRVVNGGRVLNGDTATGVVVIDCRGAAPGSTVTVTGNTVRNPGSTR